MSELVTVAIISLISTFFGAIINAYASIESAKIGLGARGRSKKSSKSTAVSLRRILYGAAIGFVFGVVFSIVLIVSLPRTVDLGSGLRVESSQKTTGQGTVVVYSHYPIGTVKYIDVKPDDSLQRVELVCFGLFRNNIYNYFSSPDGSPRSNHASVPIAIPDFCHVDFTVNDDLGGGLVGISIRAEYVH